MAPDAWRTPVLPGSGSQGANFSAVQLPRWRPVAAPKFIYDGGASSYHDWELCTKIRLRLYESAIAAKRAKLKTPEIEEAVADERDELEADLVSSESALGLPSPSDVGPTDEPEAPSPAGSRKSKLLDLEEGTG